MEAHEFHYSCPTTKDVSETDAVGARLNLTEIANRDPDDYSWRSLVFEQATKKP